MPANTGSGGGGGNLLALAPIVRALLLDARSTSAATTSPSRRQRRRRTPVISQYTGWDDGGVRRAGWGRVRGRGPRLAQESLCDERKLPPRRIHSRSRETVMEFFLRNPHPKSAERPTGRRRHTAADTHAHRRRHDDGRYRATHDRFITDSSRSNFPAGEVTACRAAER